MPKLIVHTGLFSAAPAQSLVVGQMTDHPSRLSALGYALLAPIGERDSHIFTNSENVFNGIRLAVKHKKILATSIEVIYHTEGADIEIVIDQSGKIAFWPKGFFDQTSIDLRNLAGSD